MKKIKSLNPIIKKRLKRQSAKLIPPSSLVALGANNLMNSRGGQFLEL